MAYKTPGVYVEEISTLPPSVAEVATAIPAFIGYTQTGSGDSVEVAQISTMLEYEARFGGPKLADYEIVARNGAIDSISRKPTKHFLYEALSLYFKNGGGRCYVVSIGDHDDEPSVDRFSAGLTELQRHDEPTLIVMPEAVDLNMSSYGTLAQAALAQCMALKDRFVILDVPAGDVDGFRDDATGTHALAYGAAYHPYIQTTLVHRYGPETVSVIGGDAAATWSVTLGGIEIRYTGEAAAPTVNTDAGAAESEPAFTLGGSQLDITNVSGRDGAAVVAAWALFAADNDTGGFSIVASNTSSAAIELTAGAVSLVQGEPAGVSLGSLQTSDTALYNAIKKALANERMILPPSAAVAGVYARTDRDRGVWKAPANVSLSAVIGPIARITADEQESLNVEPTSGKSINAIRGFTGKGTLVWGARTLAGNDNEWRYVSVRRLFIMIEESTKKASAFAVFEPNDAGTWLKVKGMIESFLYDLWERGALQGGSPGQAYFVNVGLGKTMTSQDVLEGRMIVEIGVAAVRPAEFVVLRFSHKLAEA